MRRYLKHFKFTVGTVEGAIYECLDGVGNSNKRWNRMDTAYFLADYLIILDKSEGLQRYELAHNLHTFIITEEKYREMLSGLINDIAKDIYKEIVNKEIELEPIKYKLRYDRSSQKIRKIGLASIKQQVYDHIMVRVCKEMFMNKIGTYQCASIKGRGQVFGKNVIETWIRMKPKQCKWIWKGDVRKFYPSVPHDKLKNLLRRDIKNNDVLYVLFFLIDTYGDKGLCIGSYLSQFLANYYLSYAYHFLSEKCFTIRKKRNGTKEEIRLIRFQLFYMDDIILFSPNKKYLKKCVKMFIKYLSDELGLDVKESHQLFPLDSRPIDMMGYKIYTYKTTVRRRMFKRANSIISKYKKKEKKMPIKVARAFMSYKGFFDNSNSIKYKRKTKFNRVFKKAREVIRREARGNV